MEEAAVGPRRASALDLCDQPVANHSRQLLDRLSGILNHTRSERARRHVLEGEFGETLSQAPRKRHEHLFNDRITHGLQALEGGTLPLGQQLRRTLRYEGDCVWEFMQRRRRESHMRRLLDCVTDNV